VPAPVGIALRKQGLQWMHRERHALRNLEMDPTIPGQPKRLFRWLWEELDQQPGELVITHRELALELGRARSSVAEWMLPLKAAGLIRVRDQDTRRGTLSIQVFRPNPGPGWQPAETDRQIRLPLDGARREASTKPDTLRPAVGFRQRNPTPKIIYCARARVTTVTTKKKFRRLRLCHCRG